MLTLRCTEGLRATLRLPDPLPEPPLSSGALGDWFVQLLDADPPLILATSQASLLSVLLPATTLRARVPRLLSTALDALLRQLAVPPALVARELAEMEPALYGPARDRQVLETMHHMTQEIWVCFGHGHDLAATAHLLAYVPRPALQMRPPAQRLAEIFGLPIKLRGPPA